MARFRNKFGMTSPSRADLRTDGSPDSEKIEHSVRKHKCETLRAWSKSKTGMSEAKAEQQSTETLSFRCWCEGRRLTRGRIGRQNVEKKTGGLRMIERIKKTLKTSRDAVFGGLCF